MKLISIVTACYNEEQVIEKTYFEIKKIIDKIDKYNFEYIFIDNSSTDNTVNIIKNFAKSDSRVKLIVNIKNFGHIRSPFHGLLAASGDAVISIVADLQDPPSMIFDFIENWEKGYEIVIGIKNKSEENKLMFFIRKSFYNIIEKISDTKQIKNFTGFGLYDKNFLNILRDLNEPYPYFRGLVSEFGSNICQISYTQPKRDGGKSKNNLYTLYDMAILGLTSYSKVPLRISSFIGFFISIISLIIAIVYLFYKLFNWDAFQIGIAPLVIGIFFFSGVQLFFLGIIGEYLLSIFTTVKSRPLVIEKERYNF